MRALLPLVSPQAAPSPQCRGTSCLQAAQVAPGLALGTRPASFSTKGPQLTCLWAPWCLWPLLSLQVKHPWLLSPFQSGDQLRLEDQESCCVWQRAMLGAQLRDGAGLSPLVSRGRGQRAGLRQTLQAVGRQDAPSTLQPFCAVWTPTTSRGYNQ